MKPQKPITSKKEFSEKMLISPSSSASNFIDANRYGKLTSAWICEITAASQSDMAAVKHFMAPWQFLKRQENEETLDGGAQNCI